MFGTQTDQLKAKAQELTKKIELQSNQFQLLKQRAQGVSTEIVDQKKKQSGLSMKIDETNEKIQGIL